MKLNRRTMAVSKARAEFRNYVLDFTVKHDLTMIEMAQILTEGLADFLKYMLRAERHPDDPDRKADEE